MSLRDDLAATVARAKTAGLTLHITVEDAEHILWAYDEALAMLRHQREIAAICELDGCCMLRDKTGPQEEKP